MQGLGESLDRAPMSSLHLRFWLLAGLGIMLDGFDFFIIGVANPLIVTYLFRIEPRGRTLDELAGVDVTAVSPRITPP